MYLPTRKPELKLKLNQAERSLLTSSGVGLSREQLCVWQVPVDGEIPNLTYALHVAVEKAANDEMRKALEK